MGEGWEWAALNNSLQVKCHLQGGFLFWLGVLVGAFGFHFAFLADLSL